MIWFSLNWLVFFVYCIIKSCVYVVGVLMMKNKFSCGLIYYLFDLKIMMYMYMGLVIMLLI